MADPTYYEAHYALRQARGPARARACVRCGNPAAQWAYDHEDPHELVDWELSRAGAPYSLDPEHYVPMCRPCHHEHDRTPDNRRPGRIS